MDGDTNMLTALLGLDPEILRRAEIVLDELDLVDQVDMIQPKQYEYVNKPRFCRWLKCYLARTDPPCKRSCADCMAVKERKR